jgi:transcriptional regulator with XRE-family HTH domain
MLCIPIDHARPVDHESMSTGDLRRVAYSGSSDCVILRAMAGSMGAAIRRARKSADLSQEDVAQRIGVTRRTLGEWERHGKVPEKHLPALRAALGDPLEADGAAPGAASNGDTPPAAPAGPDPIEVTFLGWKVTVYPDADATPEEIAATMPRILEDSYRRIQEARERRSTD